MGLTVRKDTDLGRAVVITPFLFFLIVPVDLILETMYTSILIVAILKSNIGPPTAEIPVLVVPPSLLKPRLWAFPRNVPNF